MNIGSRDIKKIQNRTCLRSLLWLLRGPMHSIRAKHGVVIPLLGLHRSFPCHKDAVQIASSDTIYQEDNISASKQGLRTVAIVSCRLPAAFLPSSPYARD